MNDPIVAIEREDPPHPPAGGLEAGVQIGDFRIERRLGAGGMGIVYQARQVSLNRPVALKVLGQALSRGTDVTRFQREAQAAARLRHPSIAQVYYIGQDRHICYMAMELVDGISLRRVMDHLGSAESAGMDLDSVVREDLSAEPEAANIRFDSPTEALPDKNTPPPSQPISSGGSESNPYLSPKGREQRNSQAHVRRCAEVVRDAALALVHAHEQGVVHRDIKPDNLLLDRKGRLHLIDFGVARFFEDQAVTYTGQLVGTPLYMSPEQVTGRGAVDARADIYSLGLVLYELMTLRPPVEATNRENLLRNIVTKPLPPVSWRNSAVPEDLQRIVHRATQKDPDQRYASASELAADLDQFLSGKPVAAPQYHFRLDEREITAARPGGVILAAFIIFLAAICLFMFFGSVSMMMGIMMWEVDGGAALGISAMQIAIAVGSLVAGIVVGRYILAARTWARWVGVFLLTLLSFGSTGGFGMLIVGSAFMFTLQPSAPPTTAASPSEAGSTDNSSPTTTTFSARNFAFAMMAFYSLPLIVVLLLGGTGIWCLIAPQTGRWFALARQLRLEHRQLREQLQC